MSDDVEFDDYEDLYPLGHRSYGERVEGKLAHYATLHQIYETQDARRFFQRVESTMNMAQLIDDIGLRDTVWYSEHLRELLRVVLNLDEAYLNELAEDCQRIIEEYEL